MKKLIDFFLDRPLIVNLLTVLIVVVGLGSLWGLQKEIFPRVDFDVIIVTTSYPGSSSEDVEKLVTIPIERALKAVEGFKTMNAVSAENTSIITIEVDPDYKLEEVEEDVQTAIDSVDDLPDDATIPRMRSINNKTRGVIKVALYGDSYNNLRNAAKKLRDRIENIRDVAFAELDGYTPDEIRVEISPDKLNFYQLTVGEVASAIENRNLNLSAGKIESEKGDIMIRTLSEFESTEDIEKVVIRSNSTGQNVRVSDIATVTRGPDKNAILQRSQGERAVFIEVKIKEKADIIDTVSNVKTMTDKFFNEPRFSSIKHRYTDDMSYYVTRRLNILKDNGLLGMALVFCCLLLFLNFSTSFITSTGAPLAFLVSFAVMSMTGISINMISMFALIMVLGMLVDDSIIVAEHYYQKLESGLKPYDAAKAAAYETVRPVTATIMTTIVAFGALLFMGGTMGKFTWNIPVVIIICLLASLAECFLILPSHLADFAKLSKKKSSKWYEVLKSKYENTLNFCVRRPVRTQLCFILVLVGSLIMAKFMRFELFPGDDVRVVFYQIKGSVGSPLEKTDKVVKNIEEILLKEIKDEELDQVRSMIGTMFSETGNKTGSHYASIIAYLTPPNERERSTDEIVNITLEKVKKVSEGYTVTVKKIQGGPPQKSPVEIELKSSSLDELKVISKKVEAELKKQDGVTTTEIDFEDGKKQIAVFVNEAEAKRLGLSTSQIAFELRRAFSGDSLTEIRESDEDIEIKVSIDEKSRGDIKNALKLHIMNAQGRRIPLDRVVKFNNQPGAFVIRRLDGKRVISVTASLDKTKTTPVLVAKQMKPIVQSIINSDHPEVEYNFGGENQDTKESMQQLAKAGLIAFFCIYFILVVMFGNLSHPFIVMSTIFFGIIGVVFAFKIFNMALSFMAMLGVVGLIGVVVNDSIVLVTFINKKREEIDDFFEAVVKASLSRFRPVILTTFTTVAGLLPVAHAPGGDPFVKPMAMSFAWGLLFATAVTLVYVPATYVTITKIVERKKRS